MTTLSVVIAHRNHGPEITRQLDAIFAQSRLPDEVIVVDDASTDEASLDTLIQLEAKHHAMRVIWLTNNIGTVAAANLGFKVATGDYLYSASADDLALPGLFEKSLDPLERWPGAGLCFSDPVLMAQTKTWTKNAQEIAIRPVRITGPAFAILLQQRLVWIAGHTTIFRRAAFESVGWLNPALRWHSDWWACLEIALRFGCCYVPEGLAALKLDPNSYSACPLKSEQDQVLAEMWRMLSLPEYADVQAIRGLMGQPMSHPTRES